MGQGNGAAFIPLAVGKGGNQRKPPQSGSSKIDNADSGGALPFDKQLHRLHALHTDGIISEQEYETKKRQILENS